MITKKFTPLPAVSYIFSCLVLLYALVYVFVFKPMDTRFSSFHSIPIINDIKVSPGYTLIAPYNRLLNKDPAWSGTIYLLDLFGRPVHTWTTTNQALYSVLKPNSNLLTVMEAPKYTELLPSGGNTGTIQELDWQSNVVWVYTDEHMHHDIVSLKNGNIVVARWEQTPGNIAQTIRGGVAGTELNGVIWSDELVEINHKGEIIWSWHSWQHLDPKKDVLGALMPRAAWTYTNGISYTEHNPIDGEEAYLVSMRSLDEVFFVRKKDGEIIWRSAKGILNTQHDPTILPNGNVLVFDNGFTRPPNPYPSYGSRVVEINPQTDKIIWQLDGGPGAIDKVRFFAPIVGGAQRLPNGNTLITDGPKGHIFEVTMGGEIVWDFINPYTTLQTGLFPNNFLFKVRRYGTNEIQWPEHIASPFPKTEYALYQILQKIYPF